MKQANEVELMEARREGYAQGCTEAYHSDCNGRAKRAFPMPEKIVPAGTREYKIVDDTVYSRGQQQAYHKPERWVNAMFSVEDLKALGELAENPNNE